MLDLFLIEKKNSAIEPNAITFKGWSRHLRPALSSPWKARGWSVAQEYGQVIRGIQVHHRNCKPRPRLLSHPVDPTSAQRLARLTTCRQESQTEPNWETQFIFWMSWRPSEYLLHTLDPKKAAGQINQTPWNFYSNRSINGYEHLSHMNQFKSEMESSWITGPQIMLELFLSPLIIWCFVTLYRERWPEAKK